MSYSTTQSFRHYSDGDLIEFYKREGDKTAIGELYKRYAHLVLAICIQYLRDKDLAKDTTIEIFEKLFDELKKREVACFKAWLSFVVKNHCISMLRKQQTTQSRIAELKVIQEIESIPAGKEEISDSTIDALTSALEKLNPVQKKCIELFYYKNMSYAQIIQLTGFTAKEVKSYIQNGKRNLRIYITALK